MEISLFPVTNINCYFEFQLCQLMKTYFQLGQNSFNIVAYIMPRFESGYVVFDIFFNPWGSLPEPLIPAAESPVGCDPMGHVHMEGILLLLLFPSWEKLQICLRPTSSDTLQGHWFLLLDFSALWDLPWKG